MEYSVWSGAGRADRLVVVGEAALDAKARTYLGLLRQEFGLPLQYQQFDLDNEPSPDAPIRGVPAEVRRKIRRS